MDQGSGQGGEVEAGGRDSLSDIILLFPISNHNRLFIHLIVDPTSQAAEPENRRTEVMELNGAERGCEFDSYSRAGDSCSEVVLFISGVHCAA